MRLKKYCVFVLLVILTANVHAQTLKLSIKTLPGIIVESFRRDYPNARFISALKQSNKGIAHYEINCSDGDSKRIIHYDTDGKIIKTEEVISADRLPDPVTNSLSKRYPKSRIMKIKLSSKDSQSEYAVLISEKKKKSEIVFAPNGSILRKR